MNRRSKLSEIYISFFVVSLCTFGGGYAMLPMLEKEIVEKRRWISREELIDLFAVAQSLPGLIGINVACLICSQLSNKNSNKTLKTKAVKINSLLTNIIASIGIMTPCIIIILIIAIALGEFREYEIVQHALNGVAVCVLALILKTIIKMWKSSIKSVPQILLFAVAAVVTILTGVSPVITILAGAVLGIVAGLISNKKVAKASEKDKANATDEAVVTEKATAADEAVVTDKATTADNEGGEK